MAACRGARKAPFLLAAIAAFQAASGIAATTVTTLPAGRFTVEREHYVYDGPPALHVDTEWRKNRLVWSSADGRVRFFHEDKGSTLAARYEVEDPERGPVCTGGGYLHAYQSSERPDRRWRGRLRSQFVESLGYCEAWIDRRQRQAYRAEFTEAAGEFGAASNC
jgi:hypothetical protein